MKLLGVAFAVALLSTFLFYRLLVGKLASGDGGQAVVVAARRLEAGSTITVDDVKMAALPDRSNVKGAYASREEVIGMMALEPIESNAAITGAQVAARDSRAAAGGRIPSGMRAVSIHVVDSSSIIALLRPGHRIDIHAVGNLNGNANLKTILQNVEVLSASPGEAGPGHRSPQVVTVLAKPDQAEVLALADSGARVRIALRNTGDSAQLTPRRLAVNQLFDGTAPAVPAVAAARSATSAASRETPPEVSVTLLVRMVGAAPAVLGELQADLMPRPEGQALEVSALKPGSDIEARLTRLGGGRQLEILSSSRVVARANQQVSVQAGAVSGKDFGLRIRLAPSLIRRGSLRLRLEPELRSPVTNGVESRRLETEIELADRQSCLVSGLLDPASAPALLDRLFPGRAPSQSRRQFIVLVTPKLAERVETAGLAPVR